MVSGSRWRKDISKKTQEEKLKYCFLTEKEKSFKYEKKREKFDYLILFFKEEFKNGYNYLIPVNHIFWFKRNIIKLIRDKSCDGNFVCPSDSPCDGHKFIDYVEMFFSSISFAVEEKKVFYKYFYFINIEYKNGQIFNWDASPIEPKCLKHLPYSRRMAYLN